VTKLRLLKSRAGVQGRTTLALRAGWALSLVAEGDGARSELLDIAKWVDPRLHEPVLSVAVAEAQLASGNRLVAKQLFTEIRRWHPRAVERDRIYRGLGEIAAAAGETEEALAFYERFEREAAASVHLGEVRMKMADLQTAAGRGEEARAILEKTLETAGVTAVTKAEALLRLGQSYVADNQHEKAIVYLMSDFRSKDWSNPTVIKQQFLSLPGDEPDLQLVDCAPDRHENLTLVSVQPQQEVLAAGVPAPAGALGAPATEAARGDTGAQA
jgi:tetratricopeptide (TPR) repeat protein